MADLIYGQFTPQIDVLSIEDVAYYWCPSQFRRLESNDGLRTDSVQTLGLQRQIVTPAARSYDQWFCKNPDETLTNAHVDSRYVIRQAWEVEWNGAVLDMEMRDHLYTLYTLQKGFWISYDEEQSREMVSLDPINADRTQFLTPTYPVAIYRDSDLVGNRQFEHQYIKVFVDGKLARWSDYQWRLDPDIGLLVFEQSIPADSVVSVSYLWRAYVRIREIELKTKDMAQVNYEGALILEQLQPPPKIERFDDRWGIAPGRDLDAPDELLQLTVEELSSNFAIGYNGVSVDRVPSISDKAWTGSFFPYSVAWTSGSPGPYTKWLDVSGFDFDLPDVPDKTLLRAVVEIKTGAVTGTIKIDGMRFAKAGTAIGPNGADLETLQSDATTLYTIDLTDSGIAYEDAQSNNLSLRMSLIFQSSGSASIESVSVRFFYAEIGVASVQELLGSCKRSLSSLVSTVTPITLDATEYEWKATFDGFNIPATDWISGVDVLHLNAGAKNGAPSTDVASMKARFRLKDTGYTFSGWRAKSNQPITIIDHALVNMRDSASVPSYGGPNDNWGRVFGAWTPTQVNTKGVEFDFDWTDTLDYQDAGNWAITYVYAGQTETFSTNDTPNSHVTAWASTPAGGIRTAQPTNAANGNWAKSSGKVTVVYTWIGAGDAPKTMRAKITSTCAMNSTSGSGSNGLGDGITSGGGTLSISGVHTETLDVTGGVATRDVQVEAYSYKALQTDGLAVASITVLGELGASVLPVQQGAQIIVYHSPVSRLMAMAYQAVDILNSTTPWKAGEGAGLIRTGDGTDTGNIRYLCSGFLLPELPGNCRFVGAKVIGKYRRVGNVSRSGNLTFKLHFSNYDSGRTGKTLAYPTTEDWVDFTVGTGSNDFWESSYHGTAAESGNTYPTILGSDINTLYELEIIGTHQAGDYYEFKDVQVQLYLAEVGDGV